MTTGVDPDVRARHALVRAGEGGSFWFRPPDGLRPVRVWYAAPARGLAETPVLVVMTGRQRNARDYRDDWRPLAHRHGALLLVVELTQQAFPGVEGYNLGNIVTDDGLAPEGQWSFSVLEPLFDAVRHDIGSRVGGYLLYGHSAGAQFVHRFLVFKPGNRVLRAVSANAGWYTALDADIEFPYGLLGSPASPAAIDEALGRRLTILLGARDDDPRADGLRRTPQAEAQGEHRVARGTYFFTSARQLARKRGTPFRWSLAVVPGASHVNAEMAPAAAAVLFG